MPLTLTRGCDKYSEKVLETLPEATTLFPSASSSKQRWRKSSILENVKRVETTGFTSEFVVLRMVETIYEPEKPRSSRRPRSLNSLRINVQICFNCSTPKKPWVRRAQIDIRKCFWLNALEFSTDKMTIRRWRDEPQVAPVDQLRTLWKTERDAKCNNTGTKINTELIPTEKSKPRHSAGSWNTVLHTWKKTAFFPAAVVSDSIEPTLIQVWQWFCTSCERFKNESSR